MPPLLITPGSITLPSFAAEATLQSRFCSRASRAISLFSSLLSVAAMTSRNPCKISGWAGSKASSHLVWGMRLQAALSHRGDRSVITAPPAASSAALRAPIAPPPIIKTGQPEMLINNGVCMIFSRVNAPAVVHFQTIPAKLANNARAFAGRPLLSDLKSGSVQLCGGLIAACG